MEVFVEKDQTGTRSCAVFCSLPCYRLSLVAKAVYSVVKAMRQREDKLLEADRKLAKAAPTTGRGGWCRQATASL